MPSPTDWRQSITAALRILMHRVKYILSIHYAQNCSERRIAQQAGISRSTVFRTLTREQRAGLTLVTVRSTGRCRAGATALYAMNDKQQ